MEAQYIAVFYENGEEKRRFTGTIMQVAQWADSNIRWSGKSCEIRIDRIREEGEADGRAV